MKAITLISALFISLSGWTSNSEILLRGTVIESSLDIVLSDAKPSRSPLERVRVLVYLEDELVHDQLTSSTGFFATVLESGLLYTVAFEKDGFLKRSIEIDTRDLPNAGQATVSQLYTDLTLYAVSEAFSFVPNEDKPAARARYIQHRGRMDWDHHYARMAFDRYMEQVRASRELAESDD